MSDEQLRVVVITTVSHTPRVLNSGWCDPIQGPEIYRDGIGSGTLCVVDKDPSAIKCRRGRRFGIWWRGCNLLPITPCPRWAVLESERATSCVLCFGRLNAKQFWVGLDV